MWLYDRDSIEYELFKQYERALVALGVNFSDPDVREALEDSSYGLEDALRAAISYILWLHEHKLEYHPNIILVRSRF